MNRPTEVSELEEQLEAEAWGLTERLFAPRRSGQTWGALAHAVGSVALRRAGVVPEQEPVVTVGERVVPWHGGQR